jgi:hypothetical protein
VGKEYQKWGKVLALFALFMRLLFDYYY